MKDEFIEKLRNRLQFTCDRINDNLLMAEDDNLLSAIQTIMLNQKAIMEIMINVIREKL